MSALLIDNNNSEVITCSGNTWPLHDIWIYNYTLGNDYYITISFLLVVGISKIELGKFKWKHSHDFYTSVMTIMNLSSFAFLNNKMYSDLSTITSQFLTLYEGLPTPTENIDEMENEEIRMNCSMVIKNIATYDFFLLINIFVYL